MAVGISAFSVEIYLLSTGAKFIEKCSLSREDLNTIVGAVSNEYVTFPRTTYTPWPAQFPVLFAFDAKSEDWRPNIVVVSTRSNPDPEWAILNVSVLDGDTEQMIAFHDRLPADFVKAILAISYVVSNLP